VLLGPSTPEEAECGSPNTVALVTGGAAIGRAICQRFATAGARVVSADPAGSRLAATARLVSAAGGEAPAVPVEAASTESVAAMVERAAAVFGGVDLLVHDAAIAEGDDVTRIGPEVWDRNPAVVLRGPGRCRRALLPGTIGRRRGVILSIASVNGLTDLGEEPYSAAKAGLINLT